MRSTSRELTLVSWLVMSVLLLWLCPSRGGAGTVFGADQAILESATQPSVSLAADLDGDGDLDVLATASGDDTVAWLENTDGAGQFGPEQTLSTSADGAWGAAAADLDGDGDLDVLVGAEIADTVLWYENTDGQGSFGPAQTVVAFVNGPRFVAAADLDGDGDLDVLATARSVDQVLWFENTDGLGSFATGGTVASGPDDPIWAEPADVDGDGDLDVLVSSSQDDTHAWYENTDGAGSFALGATITTGASSAHAVTAADVDADGDLDVVGSAGAGERVAWYANLDGAGTFGVAQSMPGTLGAQASAVADLDHDGDLDVVAAEFGLDRLAWFENTDGTGSFSGPHDLTTAVDGAIDVRVADLDGDGDPDVLGSARLGGNVLWLANQAIARRVAFGRSGARWEPQAFPNLIELAAGDLDGDGDHDGVVVRGELDPSTGLVETTLAWYANLDGRGGFGVEQVVATSPIAEVHGPVFVVDMDRDHDLDLLTTLQPSGRILWYENTDGAGTFGMVRTVSDSVAHARQVFAADLDGDSDVDVVSTSPSAQTIYWHENADFVGWTWVERTVSDSASGFWQTGETICADLDADGDLDVLAIHWSGVSGPTELFWYQNTDGDGSFGPAQPVTSDSATSVRAAFAADFDGDGDLDVATVIPTLDTIAWHENSDGQGSFGAVHPVFSGSPPPFQQVMSIAGADLDGDGDVDLVATREFDGQAVWYENTDALGSFGPPQLVDGGRPGRVAAFPADMDGDGDIDLMTAFQLGTGPGTYFEITWHEVGEASFQPAGAPAILGSGGRVLSLDTADVDGDGDPDVLSASDSQDTVRWHLNPGGQGSGWPVEVLTFAADGPSAVRAADLDGDGDPDALVATADDDTVAWYENIDGLGSFGPARIVTTVADGVATIEPADVDRDGDLDVVVGSSLDDIVAWYENTDSLGTFGVRQVISGGASGVRTVATADLDGDGDVDVLSASADDDTIDWYENLDGQGGFGIRVVTSGFSVASEVVAADLDGDGDDDVAATGSGQLAWFENTDGQATFGAAQLVSTLVSVAGQLIASDFDRDGDVDLLLASRGADAVAWYENTDGLGSFGAGQEIARYAESVEAIAVADLDRDGDLDTVHATPLLGRTIVWTANRAGQYSLAASNTSPDSAEDAEVIELLALDFQHDGAPGDADVEVASIDLRLERAPRTALDVEPTPALTGGEASALIDRIDVFRDDGSGLFEAGVDALVGGVVAFSLSDGAQTIALVDGEPETHVGAGGTGRFFVVATLAAAASVADPNAFRVRLLADATVAEHVGTTIALRRGPGAGTLPRVVDLPEPGAPSLVACGGLALAWLSRRRAARGHGRG